MFRLIWLASIHLAGFLRRWMPSNIVLDKIRTRRGLKYGVPAMLFAIPYLYVASLLIVVINDGGPGWLNLLVLITFWSALKMLWIGPISLIQLAKVRWYEHAARRDNQRGSREAGHLTSTPVLAGGAS
jgi:fatty acid desaturase